MKKILSLFMAFVLMLGSLSVTSFAYSSVDYDIKLYAPNDKEIKYFDSVKITCYALDIKEGYSIAIYEGNTLLANKKASVMEYVSKNLTEDTVFTVKVLDDDGNEILNADGEVIKADINIKVKRNFFIVLFSFFKIFFGRPVQLKANLDIEGNIYKTLCTPFPYEDVARYPDEYKGCYFYIEGEVVQAGNSYLRVSTDYDIFWGYVGDVVYVSYSQKNTDARILEGDKVKIYGVCGGIYSYTSVLDSKITIPYLKAEIIEN